MGAPQSSPDGSAICPPHFFPKSRRISHTQHGSCKFDMLRRLSGAVFHGAHLLRLRRED